ncbi:MAG: hypothetical protein HYS27_01260 [Deltaproteobacteria bacterium]|nr:hypothetical protein [Deltaproteobacteria bacterium]
MARALTPQELEEAGALLDELVAPMFEERAPGVAFWGFYTKERAADLENDEVLARFASGRGVLAVELVWDEDLELMQRGDGVVVRTLAELRALAARSRDVKDGMEQTRRNLLGVAPPAAPAERRAGPSSWLAARAAPRSK